MMFKATVLAYMMAMASAFVPHDGIPADSEIGQRLMSKARALEQQNQDQSWLVGYSIKYLGCTALVQVKGDAQGQGGGQNQNNDNSLLYTQNLVKFALCSKDTACGSCGNGVAQYVVPMNDFMDAWTESKMQAEEQACEAVRENCYCQNANDDQVCEAQCYATWGMDYCTEYAENQDFEIQRFMECGVLEGSKQNNNKNNNNNGNYNYNANSNGIDMYRQYYSGLYCASNGHDIHLAVFMDSGCSTKAPSGVYEAFNNGATLPYEKKSLIQSSECMSCLKTNNNNNNNNNNNYEVNQVCTNAYQRAAKCETGLTAGNYFYPDTSGCDYIKNVLPRLSKASAKVSSSSKVSSGGGGGGAAIAFAIIFFLTSCILGAYSFFLYRKIHRAKVNLAQSEGMMMA